MRHRLIDVSRHLYCGCLARLCSPIPTGTSLMRATSQLRTRSRKLDGLKTYCRGVSVLLSWQLRIEVCALLASGIKRIPRCLGVHYCCSFGRGRGSQLAVQTYKLVHLGPTPRERCTMRSTRLHLVPYGAIGRFLILLCIYFNSTSLCILCNMF